MSSVILLGKKKGMTRVFTETGEVIPVTVLEIQPATVVEKKTVEKHGYEALKLASGDIKESKVKKPILGFFQKLGLVPKRYMIESRVKSETLSNYECGADVDISYFVKGERIDVSGDSLGKGFAGGIKRHHFHGGDDTHGSMFHRAPGSVGASAFPSRTYKGHRLPGRMGGKRVTVQNLLIVDIRSESNVLLIKGCLPGPKGGVLEVRKSKKYTNVAK